MAMNLFRTVLGLVVAQLLVSCASAPRAFHTAHNSRVLTVKQEFQFTSVQGLLKVQHTFTVPAGTYSIYATDEHGTYYWAPHYRIPHKTGSLPDSISGGIYRENGASGTYWIFGKSTTPVTTAVAGPVGLVIQIPSEFASQISDSGPPSASN